MKTFLSKLRDLVLRRSRVSELDEEMQTHFELLVAEKIRSGLAPDAARREAHLAFGNPLVAREDAGRALGWEWLESLASDTRLAARGLSRRPAFSLGLTAILALGIGATTAIATLVRAVLLDGLPVPRPSELQLVIAPNGQPFRLSAPTIARLEAHPLTQGHVAAYASPEGAALRLGEAPAEPALVQFVNGTFFSALGISPAHGRLLTPADDEAGQVRPMAVISHRWWRTKLAAEPGAVGRTVQLNGVAITIAGIAPERFTGVSLGSSVDFWLPSGLHALLRIEPSASIVSSDDAIAREQWRSSDNVAWLLALIRQPGSTLRVQEALESAWTPQRDAALGVIDDADERSRFGRRTPRAVPSPGGFSHARNGFRAAGLTLSLLVAAVVLVTVANSSTLLLLRMLARRREMGVRLALGAGRGRLARWAVLEGLLLSAAGGLGGVLLGLQLTPLLARWLVPNAADELPGVDALLLLGLGALVLGLGLLLGAAPAWLMSRLSPSTILQNHAVGAQGSMRIGRALIVLQLVLSVLLVAVAGALALDLNRVLRNDPGFARESVVTSHFNLTSAGIAPERQSATLARLRIAAESLPQVRAVGFSAHGVLSGSTSSSRVYFRGEGVQQPVEGTQREGIDEQYFGALGIPLLRGRHFTSSDRTGVARAAIVSQHLVQQVFGGASPLGRRFGFEAAPSDKDFEIVGVVGDSRVNGVREEAPAIFYLPLQPTDEAGSLVIRVEGSAAGLVEALQRRIAAEEPSVMFVRWLTLEELTQRWVRDDLATVRLTSGFGILATGLAMLGVLGALGYLVATRSREIAVKLALGAPPSRIWRDILRESLVLGVVGASLGLVLAAVLPRLLGAWMLTGLRTEWTAIFLAALVGVAAAVLGGLVPARRASRVNPLTLLRSE